LQHAKGETENIRIAQGKHKLPVTIKDGVKALKQEIKWR
jgi:hypothetical protein